MQKSLLMPALWLLCLPPTLAAAGEVEFAGPISITPSNTFAFYNTTGITISAIEQGLPVDYLYVYHQGGETGPVVGCPVSGDTIVAYRARITNGEPGPFSRVGRISPCVKSPVATPGHPQGSNPPASFGPGQVFVAKVQGQRKYHLLADVSDTITFRNVWRAESPDGINWTWYISDDINNTNKTETFADPVSHTITSVVQPESFLHSDTVVLLNPVLRSTGAGTDNAQWWGFFNFWDGTSRIGEMLIDWPNGSPSVSILTGTNPHSFAPPLPNLGGPGGSFLVNVQPYTLATGNAKTLLHDSGGYQLWAGVPGGQYGVNVNNCNTAQGRQCNRSDDCEGRDPDFFGCHTGDGGCCHTGQTCNAFRANTGVKGDALVGGGSTFAWWPVTRFSFGSINYVYSRVRALPTGYEVGRGFPFRWNSPTGRRFLFSATNDANICSGFLFSSFFKMYVVRTELRQE